MFKKAAIWFARRRAGFTINRKKQVRLNASGRQLEVFFKQLSDNQFGNRDSIPPNYYFENPVNLALEGTAVQGLSTGEQVTVEFTGEAIMAEGVKAVLPTSGWVFDKKDGDIKSSVVVFSAEEKPKRIDDVWLMLIKHQGNNLMQDLEISPAIRFADFIVRSHIAPASDDAVKHLTGLIGPFAQRSSRAARKRRDKPFAI